MTTAQPTKFVRWPAEAVVREQCGEQGIACVLIVEGSAVPPARLRPSEDWVRPPISRADLDARVTAVRRRAYGSKIPELDDSGLLRFHAKSILLSAMQCELMTLLVDRYEDVVYRDELRDRLLVRTPDLSRNALDLHILRVRKRVTRIGLEIVTAWRRGYVLTCPEDDASLTEAALSS